MIEELKVVQAAALKVSNAAMHLVACTSAQTAAIDAYQKANLALEAALEEQQNALARLEWMRRTDPRDGRTYPVKPRSIDLNVPAAGTGA